MSPDVAVIGGGLAGAAAACRLAQAGQRVVLVEREAQARHKVCGEFISVEAAHHLSFLGLEGSLASLGAVPVDRMRVVSGRIEASAGLPFPAWSLSRLRLDAWLLDHARRCGVELRQGEAVQGLTRDGEGIGLTLASGRLTAGAAVLATGKHELRGQQRPAAGSGLIGLKIHLRLEPAQSRALAGHVELVMFAGGYAGLQMVEDGFANLCLLVAKEPFAALGRDWRRLVARVPHLARRLDGAAPRWRQPLAVYNVPYGYLHAAEDDAPLYRVGDQLAVIPSFTGDGMAIALHSAKLAAEAILDGQAADAFHRQATGVFRRPVRLAGLVSGAGAYPALQPLIAGACRLLPGLMTAVAGRTRIPRWAAAGAPVHV